MRCYSDGDLFGVAYYEPNDEKHERVNNGQQASSTPHLPAA
jgi:hypothetical protein